LFQAFLKKAWKYQSPPAISKIKPQSSRLIILCNINSIKHLMLEKMEETSDEVGLGFLSFFRKLRKKRKILLDPVNPV